MPIQLENVGSNARDFAFLERNLLSHLRLAALLGLFASSLLLNARLPSPEQPTGRTPHSKASIPLASIQIATALVAIAAGVWEYKRGCRDMYGRRAFLKATRSHSFAMIFVALVIFATCIVLLADEAI